MFGLGQIAGWLDIITNTKSGNISPTAAAFGSVQQVVPAQLVANPFINHRFQPALERNRTLGWHLRRRQQI